MSGVAVRIRQRTRTQARPTDRRTKADYVYTMRAAALSMLRRPDCNEEMAWHANLMLEDVGDLLTLPRTGWYPRRPTGWRP